MSGRTGRAAKRTHSISWDRGATLLFLQRATFGATPALATEVERVGHLAWLEQQLHPAQIDDGPTQRKLLLLPSVALGNGARKLLFTDPPRRSSASCARPRSSAPSRAAASCGR